MRPRRTCAKYPRGVMYPILQWIGHLGGHSTVCRGIGMHQTPAPVSAGGERLSHRSCEADRRLRHPLISSHWRAVETAALRTDIPFFHVKISSARVMIEEGVVKRKKNNQFRTLDETGNRHVPHPYGANTRATKGQERNDNPL